MANSSASKSITAAIREIDLYFHKEEMSPICSGYRKELRELIEQLSAKAFRVGFKLGHQESYAIYKKIKKVPCLLEITANMKLFYDSVDVEANSVIK